MNPLGVPSGSNNGLNRPSVFSENYPPVTSSQFNWNFISSEPQRSDFREFQGNFNRNVGFNMQPPGGVQLQNFQFNSNSGHFLQNPVQFPLTNIHNHSNIERPMCSFRYKRKTDSPPLQPAKQFISEEKMTEHLSKLHISSETPTEMENDQVRERRLYMCEEMKRFQAQNTEPVLPESILTSLTRPCTALVLWKPPESILAPAYNRNNDENENNNNNNNNLNENYVNPMSVPLNEMDFDDL